jgi:putative lipoic acid-binding regulatory protein
MDLKACKAKIGYPCRWLYKVIGRDREQINLAIAEIITHGVCDISISNNSSTGKYICLNVEVLVENEEMRNSIYMDLKTHPHVTIVL